MRYEYAALPQAMVLNLVHIKPAMPDAYLSDDWESRIYKDLLARGFRWVRSEEGLAIFEREKAVPK